MEAYVEKRSHKAGLPPGSLVPVGEARDEPARITIIDYKGEELEQRETTSVEECFPYKDKTTVSWINVDGVHDPEVIHQIGRKYGLHPLTQEDILNTNHRPKMEDFGDYLYITLKMLYLEPGTTTVIAEQVSLIVGDGFVLSFQEAPGDVFQPVRERIKRSSGRIRNRGPDYLAYALIDAVVDQYFVILETLGEEIEALEDELQVQTGPDILNRIYFFKREVILLRRSVWPLREVISGLEKSESALIDDGTKAYLRDVYDHTLSITDTIETFREMISTMLESHRSIMSEKMNEVMKVLTVIATIFIPLTFIAGIYGMNFEKMPELKMDWGYPAVWVVMVAVSLVLILFFRRKKWV